MTMEVGVPSRVVTRYRRWTPRILILTSIAGLLLGACGAVVPKDTARVEPEAPAVAAGPQGQTSVTVTWTAPEPDLVITGYALRWRPVSETDWTEVEAIPGTETTYTITSLQPGTEYEVQVRGVFGTEAGEWSQSLTLATTGSYQLPAVAAGPQGQTSVTVTWTAPEPDLVITGYALRWRRVSETDWTEVEAIPGTETTYTITSLQPGTEYEVQVRGVFGTEAGEWSQSLTLATTASSPPPPADPPPRRPTATLHTSMTEVREGESFVFTVRLDPPFGPADPPFHEGRAIVALIVDREVLPDVTLTYSIGYLSLFFRVGDTSYTAGNNNRFPVDTASGVQNRYIVVRFSMPDKYDHGFDVGSPAKLTIPVIDNGI